MNFFPPVYQHTKFGPYVQFENFLDDKECSRIISQMNPNKLEDLRVDNDGKKDETIRSARGTALLMSPINQWIFERLATEITRCNFDIYGYDLAGFNEAIQLLEYREGSHYSWHMDIGNKTFSQRKLSAVVQLSHPDDYEGGDLEFFNNGSALRNKGAMILFPSFMVHRVTPLTKGLRRSLVLWVSGNPFR